MADPTPTRKSGRQRVPNRRYSVDPLEGLEVRNQVEERDAEPSQLIENNSDDADFSAEQAAAAAEVEVDEENELIADDASEYSAVGSPGEEPQDATSNASPVGSEKEGEAPGRRASGVASYVRSDWKKKHPDSSLHSRGMTEGKSFEAKETYLKTLYGTGVEDLVNITRSRDQWVGEVSLPRRSSDDGKKGMRRFFSHTKDKREMEATVGWDWYYKGGKGLFATRQKMRSMSDSEGKEYIHKPTKSIHSVLLGSYGKQKIFHLSQSEYLELGEAWKAATADDSEKVQDERQSRKGGRAGWMLNVGTSVRCLDWASNHDGDAQYLAIATSEAKTAAKKELHTVSPAFTPSPPSPTCIQIWAFASCTEPGQEGLIESRTKPRLRVVICTEWGPLKQLKWCPMPRKPSNGEPKGIISIGLLASVWGDGCVRVLDVQMDKDSNVDASYGTQNMIS
jgi:transcription factor C subunit 6